MVSKNKKRFYSCSFVQEVIWLFILILVEHANKDDDMGPKKQGIQEKTKINEHPERWSWWQILGLKMIFKKAKLEVRKKRDFKKKDD